MGRKRKKSNKRYSYYGINFDGVFAFIFMWLFFTIVPIIINFVKENYVSIIEICVISLVIFIIVFILFHLIKIFRKVRFNVELPSVNDIYNRYINSKYVKTRKKLIQNSKLFF